MLEVCPACQFFLRGLPEKHVCPECGFRYDRNACHVAPVRMGRIVYGIASTAMFLTGVFLSWWETRGIGPLIFITIGLMGMMGALWHLKKKNRFVLVSLDELRIVDFADQERVFSMSQIVDAEWSWISGSVTVTAQDKRELVVIPAGFLGSARRSRLLVLSVRQHLAARRRQKSEKIRKGVTH